MQNKKVDAKCVAAQEQIFFQLVRTIIGLFDVT